MLLWTWLEVDLTGDGALIAEGGLLTTGAGAGCTGRLLKKLVDAPKMSGRGSPRIGWLVVPTGMANGIGVADCVGGAGRLTG